MRDLSRSLGNFEKRPNRSKICANLQVSSLLHLPDDVRIPVPLSGHRGHMLLGPDVVEDVALALPVDRTLAEHAPNLVHLNTQDKLGVVYHNKKKIVTLNSKKNLK